MLVASADRRRLGVGHTVTEPPARRYPRIEAATRPARATVLVSDGMLSAFENVGSGFRPDPRIPGGPLVTEAGGHGGELLRGGYAQAAVARPGGAAARAAAARRELLRRMTTRRLGLLRPGAARAYLASLAPAAAALARGPLAALDGFYLANRAGRWSAAARQAYLLRSPLAQPLFADRVVASRARRPARGYRMSDRLHRDVLGLLCPGTAGHPAGGQPWHGEPRIPATVLTVPREPADRGLAAGPRRGPLPARLRPGPRRRRARCSAS